MIPAPPTTPKASGVREAGPGYVAQASVTVARLEHLSLRLRAGPLWLRDVPRAKELERLASRLRAAADVVRAWDREDPGRDARHAQLAKLVDLLAAGEDAAPLDGWDRVPNRAPTIVDSRGNVETGGDSEP